MPILDIEVVLAGELDIDSTWAQRIADASGKIFGTKPGRTWVRVRKLQLSDYAENGTELAPDLHPIFVSVLKSQLPPVDRLRAESQELTSEIARIVGRQTENVHILYLPPAAERMSFGGTLVEKAN